MGDRGIRLSVKLIACSFIIFAAAVIKVYFPDTMTKLSGYITEQVDFKAAFQSVGEGISGKVPLKEALGEAYKIAFLGRDREDVEYVNAETVESDGIE